MRTLLFKLPVLIKRCWNERFVATIAVITLLVGVLVGLFLVGPMLSNLAECVADQCYAVGDIPLALTAGVQVGVLLVSLPILGNGLSSNRGCPLVVLLAFFLVGLDLASIPLFLGAYHRDLIVWYLIGLAAVTCLHLLWTWLWNRRK